jgi:hypothetical protein
VHSSSPPPCRCRINSRCPVFGESRRAANCSTSVANSGSVSDGTDPGQPSPLARDTARAMSAGERLPGRLPDSPCLRRPGQPRALDRRQVGGLPGGELEDRLLALIGLNAWRKAVRIASINSVQGLGSGVIGKPHEAHAFRARRARSPVLRNLTFSASDPPLPLNPLVEALRIRRRETAVSDGRGRGHSPTRAT